MASSKKVDTTLVVLREIRDAVRTTNERVDALAGEIRTTNERMTQMELRVLTELGAVALAVRDVAGLIRETRAAERIAALEQRLAVVERKVG